MSRLALRNETRKETNIQKIIKIISAGVVSFILLNLFCILYANPPIHFTSKTGSTDYIWEPNVFYSRATEGFAWGFIDENGYNNIKTERHGRPNILLMGSSHLEAFNVDQKESAVSVLNDLFLQLRNGMSAYSIATSGHDFCKNIANLKRAIKEFTPQDYIVIETSSVKFVDTYMRDSLTDGIEKIPSYDKGILKLLQKLPYFRLANAQMENWFDSNVAKKSQTVQVNDISTNYVSLLNKMMMYVGNVAKDNNIKVVVLYQPALSILADGGLTAKTEEAYLKIFVDACTNSDIGFINMTDTFISNYVNTSIMPHGFGNTAVGKGHLNKYGHKLIANEIYSYIIENTNKEIKQ